MATTRLIVHRISKGSSILKSMKDRFDYGQDISKTKNGELVSAYMCDPRTADVEFNLSKAKYTMITGREQKKDANVLCYQIRQSFMEDETDPETALKIGHDLAMRWTKGKHAFFVVSHIDRPHPHVHIYYNSTSLDNTRKYRNFWGSSWALQRLSDRICLENDLSVIANPKLKSKGKYKHYGHWLGNKKQPTFQEKLKMQIDISLMNNPKSFDEFLLSMVSAGYEVKHGRGGVISFRTKGQERYTRLRSSTLGEGYGIEEIQDVIKSRGVSKRTYKPELQKFNLIIDIQSRLKNGKGPAYERWAKVFNLKQMAAAVQYLQENNLFEYEQLDIKAMETTDRFHNASDKLKTIESAMKRNAELKAAIIDYAKTKPVFLEYKAKKYSNKFLSEHESEIAIYRAAQATMKDILQGDKLPKMEDLKAEWQTLTAEKKSGYIEYRTAQKDMRDIITVKANIDHLLGITDIQKVKGHER
jgi:hypothetical protein